MFLKTFGLFPLPEFLPVSSSHVLLATFPTLLSAFQDGNINHNMVPHQVPVCKIKVFQLVAEPGFTL